MGSSSTLLPVVGLLLIVCIAAIGALVISVHVVFCDSKTHEGGLCPSFFIGESTVEDLFLLVLIFFMAYYAVGDKLFPR